jgi:hypothetical protein
MQSEPGLNKGMAAITVIWIAMLATLPLYLVAGLVAAPTLPVPMPGETFDLLRKALYVVGMATLFAVGTVRRLIWKGGRRPDGQAPAPAAAAMPRYVSAVVASMAMCESIGIYGLLLFLLGRNSTDLFLLLAASAAAMVYHRPKREELAA